MVLLMQIDHPRTHPSPVPRMYLKYGITTWKYDPQVENRKLISVFINNSALCSVKQRTK